MGEAGRNPDLGWPFIADRHSDVPPEIWRPSANVHGNVKNSSAKDQDEFTLGLWRCLKVAPTPRPPGCGKHQAFLPPIHVDAGLDQVRPAAWFLPPAPCV